MKSQLTHINAPASIWLTLHQIDQQFSQLLPLATQLEKTIDLLIESLRLEAVWAATFSPLPPVAFGVVCTPLTIAPNAKIKLHDSAPITQDGRPTSHTLLEQLAVQKTPLFIEATGLAKSQIDTDLGDALFTTFDITPIAAVPLVTERALLGVLVIGQKAGVTQPLAAEWEDFLTYLGKHLARNLENTYLMQELERHSDTLVTLNQIAQTITSSLNIDEVIQKTMAGINKIMDVEAGSLLLMDEESNELYFKITLRGENKQVTSYRLQPGEGIAGWVLVNNKPVLVNNPASDERFTAKIDRAINFKTKRVLCVPLVVQGKPIGVLEMLNKHSGPFNDNDQGLLVSLAASLGIALKNALMYEESQARAHINEIINQITAIINAGHGLSETAKIIFKQLQRLFKFDHISASLLNDSKDKIRQWIFNEHGCIEQTKQAIPLKGSELAHVIHQGKGYVSGNIGGRHNAKEIYPDNEILLIDGVKSKAVVPLAAHKIPNGSLTLGSRQIGAYGSTELKLLEQLAPQLAIAIDKALLIDAMEQRTNELQLLNRLGEMLVSTTDISVIVDTTLNMLPRLLPGDVHGVVIAADEGVYTGLAIPYGFKQEHKIIQEIFDTFSEISNANNLQLVSSRCIAGNMPVPVNWQPVTELSLPILTRQGAQGLMYLASGREESFSDNVLRIFSLIVSQISATIANAHLFQQVEQERARLAAILASITDAVLVVNRNGRIVLDNPAARELIGVEESQRGRLLAESTHLDTLIELFESAMQGSTPTGEIDLDDGRTFFASLSPVAIGNSEVIGWVATMQDVSHFKELNQLKNDFVSSVSHDLRSPLSTILLAANLVGETGPINKDQKELLNAVDRQVRAMGQLIDDILDVGKIEAGIDMEMEPCDINPIVQTVTEALLPQAADKSIELSSNLKPNLPTILANATRLSQVLFNLVGNAIKYTPVQGKVTIKAYAQDGEIRVQVVDTGMGIPASDQPHIFEKFYRVRGDHMAEIKGTGLGLAITKGIVEKHNGRIWLESVFGKGSTFTVALPIYEKSSAPAEPSEVESFA